MYGDSMVTRAGYMQMVPRNISIDQSRYQRGQPLLYRSAGFREAERAMRQQYGGQEAQLRHRLAQRGLSGEALERALVGYRTATAQGFQKLAGQRMGQIEKSEQEAKERRRSRFGSILGFALNLIPQIGAYRTLSGAINRRGSTPASAPTYAGSTNAPAYSVTYPRSQYGGGY